MKNNTMSLTLTLLPSPPHTRAIQITTRHTESLIHYKYIKPLEVQDKSSDPSCLGALYGTPFDIYALACMVIGMALGIPCIEIRDHELRSKDLQDAGNA